MREIKFRAWHTSYGMSKPFGIDGHPVYEKDKTVPYWSKGMVQLSQFTGLKDKNGREIYEGDILSLWPDEGNLHFARVIFQDGAFQYQHLMKPQAPDVYDFIHNRIEFHEIVGNVYENPELLTQSPIEEYNKNIQQ